MEELIQSVYDTLTSLDVEVEMHNIKVGEGSCVITYPLYMYEYKFSEIANDIYAGEKFQLQRDKDVKVIDTQDTITIQYRIIANNPLQPDDITSVSTGDTSYGAISPNGDFFECEYSQHHYLSHELLEHGKFKDSSDGYSAFERNGWLKLTGAMLTDCEFTFEFEVSYNNYSDGKFEKIKKHFRITPEQIAAMKAYKLAQGSTKINFNYHEYDLDELDQLFNDDGSFNYKYHCK